MAAVDEDGEKPYFGPAIWLSRPVWKSTSELGYRADAIRGTAISTQVQAFRDDVQDRERPLLLAVPVGVVVACVEIIILRRVPPRHRRDAFSTAWRCGSLTARRSQRVIAEK